MENSSTELAVIKALKDRAGYYISGEELAKEISVSRAAIWKHVESLRNKGYVIEAIPKRGYKLVSSPGNLIPEEILPLLNTKFFGKKIIHKEIIDSTNILAKELAEKGWDEGTVVIAEEQSMGKGRLDRSWASPPGGIWLSAILRPKILPQEASRFTILAAVSAAKVIERLGVEPSIKWPNDILVSGKKVCGILLELTAQPDIVDYLIIGFGINANFTLDKLPHGSIGRATTLMEVLGKDIDRRFLVANLMLELESDYERLLAGRWHEILNDWMSRCGILGSDITLGTLQGNIEGEFIGVDDFGAMRLRLPDGAIKTFAAGDVTIKKHLI